MADKTKTSEQIEADKKRRAEITNTTDFEQFAKEYKLTELGKKQVSKSKTLHNLLKEKSILTYQDIKSYWMSDKAKRYRDDNKYATPKDKTVEKPKTSVATSVVKPVVNPVVNPKTSETTSKDTEKVLPKGFTEFIKNFDLNKKAKKILLEDDQFKELMKDENITSNEYAHVFIASKYFSNKDLYLVSDAVHGINPHEIFGSFIDNLGELHDKVFPVKYVDEALSETFTEYLNTIEDTPFGKIDRVSLNKWHTSGSDNDCLIHAFFTITSPKYRELSLYDKRHAVNEFRRVTLTDLLEKHHEYINIDPYFNDPMNRATTIKLLSSIDFLNDRICGLLATLFNIQIILFEENASAPGIVTNRVNPEATEVYFMYNKDNIHFSAISLFEDNGTEQIWSWTITNDDNDDFINLIDAYFSIKG